MKKEKKAFVTECVGAFVIIVVLLGAMTWFSTRSDKFADNMSVEQYNKLNPNK